MADKVTEGFFRVRDSVEAAARRSGRDPKQITIIGVTKTLPAELVVKGYDAGLRHFGENRFQGTPEKMAVVKSLIGGEAADAVEWHFIGQLQTNKVRAVLENFSLVHSLDREKLIDKIDRIAAELGIIARGLLQVNVSGADSQGGLELEEVAKVAEFASSKENLRIEGLMAIGPITEDEAQLHQAFAQVRNLSEDLAQMKLPGVSMAVLSMGMSSDYEIAVEEGATHIRVGTAIFGPRQTLRG